MQFMDAAMILLILACLQPAVLESLKNMRMNYGIDAYREKYLFENVPDVYTYNYTIDPPIELRKVELRLMGISQYFYICEIYFYSVCNNGSYGGNCENCGNCLNSTDCDKYTGACPTSCESGYKGSTCKTGCGHGEYGLDCNSTCGRCINDETCNRYNGSCSNCTEGFLQPMCTDCVDYKFGENCTDICYCAGGPCNTTTGICPPGGCTEGYHGAQCITECTPGTYGINCNTTCGFCKNNEPCDRFNGTCRCCQDGYIGHNCTEKITCDECIDVVHTEIKKEELLAAAIGGTAGVFLIVTAVVVAAIIMCRKVCRNRSGKERRPPPMGAQYEMPTRSEKTGGVPIPNLGPNHAPSDDNWYDTAKETV